MSMIGQLRNHRQFWLNRANANKQAVAALPTGTPAQNTAASGLQGAVKFDYHRAHQFHESILALKQ